MKKHLKATRKISKDKFEAPEATENTAEDVSAPSDAEEIKQERFDYPDEPEKEPETQSIRKRSGKRANKKKMRKPVKALIIIVSILLAILLVTGIVFFAMYNIGKGQLMRAPENDGVPEYDEYIHYNGKKYEYNKDVIAVAFLGIDRTTFDLNPEEDFIGASDADIIFTIDTSTGRMSALSVPRDTVCDIDVYSSSGEFVKTTRDQLCLAYAYGNGGDLGSRNTLTSISRVLMNVPIFNYFALDLSGIGPVNDAIGGVTLVPTYNIPESGIYSGSKVTLLGDMAMAYVRMRDTDTAEGAVGRAERQLQYIRAFFSQVMPAISSDLGTIPRLYNTAAEYSQTNISVSSATYLGTKLLTNGISSIETTVLKGTSEAVPAEDGSGRTYAEFTPDRDFLTETVLALFYKEVKE